MTGSKTKKCCRCDVVRPITEFGPRPENRDGKRGYCKPCDAANAQAKRDADRDGHRKYRRDYYKKNPESFKAGAMKWQAENPERKKELNQKWRDKNREKVTAYYRKTWLKKYCITPEDFEAMYESQGGVCAICKTDPGENLCVDHCHDTGEVRGLLCRKCNSALGMLGDDVKAVLRAAKYLSTHSPEKQTVLYGVK